MPRGRECVSRLRLHGHDRPDCTSTDVDQMADAEKDVKNSADDVANEKGVVISTPRLRRCGPEGARLEEMLEEMENDKLIVRVQIEHSRTSRLELTRLSKET